MNEIFNRQCETSQRRQLRSSMPDAEVILWSRLKGRQLFGCKFRRQYSVGSFVIDFFSVESKLGIELDGDSHFQPGAAEYDRNRQQFIESFGIRIVRILNTDVYDNLDGVLEMIGREVLDGRERRETSRLIVPAPSPLSAPSNAGSEGSGAECQKDLSQPRDCDRPPPPLPPLRKGGKGIAAKGGK